MPKRSNPVSAMLSWSQGMKIPEPSLNWSAIIGGNKACLYAFLFFFTNLDSVVVLISYIFFTFSI